MANRVIRDCTDSYRIDQLSVHAEVFFYRLLMKADDFGKFYGNPKILKAQLFPLRLDSVRETDISRWISELENVKNEKGEKAGLIVSYESENKPFVKILEFGQRLRVMKSKFPDAPADSCQREEEVESEVEVESELEGPASMVFSLEKFEKEIRNAYKQIEAAARRNKTTPEKILSMVPDFIDTCRIKAKTSETWKEYCNYFSNWLLTEFSKQKQNATGKNAGITKEGIIDSINSRY